MNNSSNPEWYETLKKDQPLRTTTFTKELAGRIYKQALAESDRQTALPSRRWMLAIATAVSAMLCVVLLFAQQQQAAPPASASAEITRVAALDPDIRDTLIHLSGAQGFEKRILAEKRIYDDLVLIYSAPPESTESSELFVDILKWTDYGGDRSVGTGLDGWALAHSGFGALSGQESMPGVRYDGLMTYGELNVLTGKLFETDIAGILVTDGSGRQWAAQVFPCPDGSRYWFADMTVPVEDYRIDALDSQGKVLSSYSPS